VQRSKYLAGVKRPQRKFGAALSVIHFHLSPDSRKVMTLALECHDPTVMELLH